MIGRDVVSSLLQVSDPHFGTEQPQVVEALLRLAHQQQPGLVVMSGDITQRARPRQFDAARAFTDRLPAPVVVIPGNHDIPLFNLCERALRPYAGFQRVFGASLEPEHLAPDLMLLCVNTTRAHRHSNGEVSRAQIERVARRLEQAEPGQLRVVVVHQPVAITRPEDRSNLLRGHDRAVRRWAQAGADIVMGGHIHLPYVVAVSDTPRPLWAVQAGTAVSTRVRDRMANSVNLLRWGDGEVEGEGHTSSIASGICRVERWDFDARLGAFVHHSTHPLATGRRLAHAH